jgi:hypothetical protein
VRADGRSVPVLTYHSIASERGPTSIPPETFRMQMDVLAECRCGAMTCDECRVEAVFRETVANSDVTDCLTAPTGGGPPRPAGSWTRP